MSDKKFRESFSLKTDDIPGAKPSLKQYSFTNKISFSNSNQGIEKSSPQSNTLKTNRNLNPLTPEYKLPSHVSKPITPPKFLRDTLDISDINGCKSRLTTTREARNTLDVSDISIKKSPKLAQKSFMPTQDPDKRPIERRNTNPLCPEYKVIGENNTVQVIGEIPGNKPKTLVNMKQTPHNRSLDVSDIQGLGLKNASTSITFVTPKLKVRDLATHGSISGYKSLTGHNSPGCLTGYSSPKSSLSISSYPSLSLQNSPCASLLSPQQKQAKNRIIKKMPLPKSPQSVQKPKYKK